MVLFLDVLKLPVTDINCVEENWLAKVITWNFLDERDPACNSFAKSEIITTVLD